jgi:hypothetical protein
MIFTGPRLGPVNWLSAFALLEPVRAKLITPDPNCGNGNRVKVLVCFC